MKRLCVAMVCMLLCGLVTGCAADIPAASTPPPTTTTVPSPTTTTTVVTAKTDENGVLYENSHYTGKQDSQFELPLQGATGYASYPLPLYASPLVEETPVATLQPGEGFTVLQEEGDWWRIAYGEREGYVLYATCYLNIADVVPSIVLDNTNATASVFVSSGVALPTITGEQLYNATYQNDRFGDVRQVMAANYGMVKKIYAAQQAALAEGYTLVINETFRPWDVQQKVAAQLATLRQQNEAVRAGIDAAPWGIGWFIASRMSTHQMGVAMDVSLAKVTTVTWRICGGYRYPQVTGYTPCRMPTAIHELSSAAVALNKPVSSYSATAWKAVAPADTMTEDALRLQRYCTEAGMSPLASEWWHFNDLETKAVVGNRYTADVFYVDSCYSKIPE